MATLITLPKARADRLRLIRTLFTQHSGPDLSDNWLGGRAEALQRLSKIQPASYSKNRNFLNGDVTLLSPYIRHGCISISEAIEATKKIAKTDTDKLLFEFAWRDYWRKVWYFYGHDIESDMEPAKVALRRNAISEELKQAQTGLRCIDHFVSTLNSSGYLHNHARMWLASYMIHWRGFDWRASADWMRYLLLDGDEASNNLSWQWVASTFGSKPYFFNKENLRKYSDDQFCNQCHAHCPFDDSYEALNEKLFKPTTEPIKVYKKSLLPTLNCLPGLESIVLFHDEMLSSKHSLYQSSSRKIFIYDPSLQENWATNRLQFIADCLNEMPEVEVWVGNTAEVLNKIGVNKVMTQNTPNLKLKAMIAPYGAEYVQEQEPYSQSVAKKLGPKEIKRFSKYWNIVGPEILAPL
jgi:deoxyribodipyrimidine photo-lyase